ncbi:hypothetical protein CPS_0959 [Colwellia psychrerythraea 34H]|uniref:Uncharacterized protein n=1 Tax=Colwellia psychrerythraea (strain 34H / ATCC BAA-681) TaxID=167879 RepID=Q487Q7_COLP3|nr:hypothetical protein CPS_0959 [Colwellia psychrerythraea 34H]
MAVVVARLNKSSSEVLKVNSGSFLSSAAMFFSKSFILSSSNNFYRLVL